MAPKVQIRIVAPGIIGEERLTYVVIGALQGEQWLFVRHRDRESWEMPAGHIEEGETADQAAVRELFEETGTVESSLEHLCDYTVQAAGKTESGRLYLAVVRSREKLPESEIEEVRLSGSFPGNLTYPEVQGRLFELCRKQLHH